MIKASKRIVFLAENVNNYGFRTLVDGVDIQQYEKNPLMLWMHIRAFHGKDAVLPLGNVIEIKKETLPDVGLCLTGLPVFDEKDPFAAQILQKYEDGVIRMASAGIRPVTWSDAPEHVMEGQTGWTMAESKLREISIVDLGVDDDALQDVVLYDEDENIIKLSDAAGQAVIPSLKNQQTTDMKMIQLSGPELLVKLALPEDADSNAVMAKILEIVNLSDTQKGTIETLKADKVAAELKATEAVNKLAEAEVISLVDKAIVDRKILAGQREQFIKLATADQATVKAMFSGMPANPTIKDTLIAGGEANDKNAKRMEELMTLSYNELFSNGGLTELKKLDPEKYVEKSKENPSKS